MKWSYITGAADPSDHLPTGTINTSIGSGAPLDCGFRTVKGDDPMLRLLILGCVFAYVTLPAASAKTTDAGYADELSPSLAGGAKAMHAQFAEI
jgi:hypothetical protein